MSKFTDQPRSKFADEPELEDFKDGSIAWLVQRYIEDMAQPKMKPIGDGQLCILRVIQRMPIGAIKAAKLKKQDVVEFAKQLRNSGLRKARVPATVNQYIVYLSGVLSYAPSAWEDCEDVSAAAVVAAKPFLVKHGYIGKSAPRQRVPVDDEIPRLLAYFGEQTRRKIPMQDIIAFALVSTRRLGEIARIQHGDIDWQRKDADGNAASMYLVRDLKHPTKKKGNDKSFPLFAELAEIINRQPRTSTDPSERVFKFNPHSASASYTAAKHALGIEGLRFHDNRRSAITLWLARLKSPHKVKLISGHETTAILERVYDATDPVTLHAEYALTQQPASL